MWRGDDEVVIFLFFWETMRLIHRWNTGTHKSENKEKEKEKQNYSQQYFLCRWFFIQSTLFFFFFVYWRKSFFRPKRLFQFNFQMSSSYQLPLLEDLCLSSSRFVHYMFNFFEDFVIITFIGVTQFLIRI